MAAADSWSAGASYERFMGRWSRHVARAFVEWLGVRRGAHWLDVGCGTGSMTRAILERADPESVTACDPAEPFVRTAEASIVDARVSFVVAGTGALPPRAGGAGGYDCITSLLALNFFPDPVSALEEMAGLCVPGGALSACVWDYTGHMVFLRTFWDTVVGLDPSAASAHESIRFARCRPDALVPLFETAGAVDVVCDPIDIETRFVNFDDYWSGFLQGAGPAGAYVASCAPAQRDALADALRAELGTAGASLRMPARAWAVRGRAGKA